MFQGTVLRRRPASQQTSFEVDPFAQLLAEVDAVLPAPRAELSKESRAEHEQLIRSMAAIVAAAPVREVRKAERIGDDFRLELECGHVARYFALRLQIRCHECAGQPSPTRWPAEEDARG